MPASCSQAVSRPSLLKNKCTNHVYLWTGQLEKDSTGTTFLEGTRCDYTCTQVSEPRDVVANTVNIQRKKGMNELHLHVIVRLSGH